MLGKIMEQKRVYAFDVMRIIAALGVIVIHVASDLVGSAPFCSAEYGIANVIGSIARTAVPLFIMISGALMLDENKPMLAKKPVIVAARTYGVLMIWSFIYAAVFYILLPVYIPALSTVQLSREAFVCAIASGHFHLWYLFMIIGLYLITPVLRLFIKQENRKKIEYLLVLTITVNLAFPFINYVWNFFSEEECLLSLHFSQFDFSFVRSYLIYYILGWYLVNTDFTPGKRAVIYLVGVCGALATILFSYYLSSETFKAYGFFYSYGTLNVLAESVAVFVFFLVKWKQPAKAVYAKRMQSLAQLSFGVYLIHPFVLFVVEKMTKEVLQIPNSYCERVLINFILVAGPSFVLSYILSKIPLLRRITR